jgi:tetratricopeptide (TPR) repeat protein
LVRFDVAQNGQQADSLLYKLMNKPTTHFRSRLLLPFCACGLALLLCAPLAAAQRRPTRNSQSTTNTQAATQPEFERLSAQATSAREAGRFEEAIELYRKALALRPRWLDGLWYMGTLLYERDAYREAAQLFAKAGELQPKAGAAWAMLGLCEYRLARYDDALGHLHKARRVGLVNNPELIRVMIYHEGLLLLLRGDFETAHQRFSALAYEGLNTEDLLIGLGLASLRNPVTPSQIGPDHRDRAMIRRVGWAEFQAAQKNRTDAQSEYERLIADFPKTPNIQYAFGRFLLNSRRDEEGALAAFHREIENAPDSAVARIQIAYLKLKSKDTAAGIPFAEEALKLSPRNAVGHYVLGRLLFDIGQTERSIKELEGARNLAPMAPNIHFALARAYSRANRKADAERARETFTRLNKQAEEFDNKGFLITGDAPPEENKP